MTDLAASAEEPEVSVLAMSEVLALRNEVESLQRGLASSRLIGAAVGLTMSHHRVSRDAAFELLRSRSQDSNVRLTAIAADLVADADRAVSETVTATARSAAVTSSV